MVFESPMKGFLKNNFGLGKGEPTLPLRPTPSTSSDAKEIEQRQVAGGEKGFGGQAVPVSQPVQPPPATPQTPNFTEAYLNRNKGRKKASGQPG